MNDLDPRPRELRTRTINDIVRLDPGALPVLTGFGFDTCCGGDLPLEEACRRHGLDVERVVVALDRR